MWTSGVDYQQTIGWYRFTGGGGFGGGGGGGGVGPLSVNDNQYVHSTTGTNSQLTVTTSVANQVICVLFFENSHVRGPTTADISDNRGLTWQQLGSSVLINSGATYIGAFFAQAPTAQTYTITLDWSNVGWDAFASVNAFCVVNGDTVTFVDPNASNPTGNTTGLASMTTSNAKDIIFGVALTVSPGTVAGGWTTLQNVSGDFFVSMYRIESATNTFTLNTGGGTQLGSFIGALKGN